MGAIDNQHADPLKRQTVALMDYFLQSKLPLKNLGPEVIFFDSRQKRLLVNTTSSKFVSIESDQAMLRSSIARTMCCLATNSYVAEGTDLTTLLPKIVD